MYVSHIGTIETVDRIFVLNFGKHAHDIERVAPECFSIVDVGAGSVWGHHKNKGERVAVPPQQ